MSIIECEGARLAVRDSGGEGIPIVFVSGGPGMPNYLADIAGLVEGRRTVLYDQRGTGESIATDGNYSTDAHVEDLEHLRKFLESDRIHLFGHSWGGLLAQLYATAHIDAVASLFLSSPTPGVGGHWVAMEKAVMQYNKEHCSSGAFAMMGLRSLLGRIPLVGRGSLQKMFAQVWLNYQQNGEQVPADSTLLSGIGRRTTFTTRASAIGLPSDYLDSVLPNAEVPFTIVFGANDIYGDHTQITVDRYANANVEFWDGCGHLAWLDAPKRFARRINEFYEPLS